MTVRVAVTRKVGLTSLARRREHGLHVGQPGEYVMSNNFAFGGIDTSLIFRRVS